MRKGRCIHNDFGHIGCAVNVFSIIDGMCTGQNHCDIPLLNQQFHSLHPCPSDLMPYLEASYDCIKGTDIYLLIYLLIYLFIRSKTTQKVWKEMGI